MMVMMMMMMMMMMMKTVSNNNVTYDLYLYLVTIDSMNVHHIILFI